MKDAEETYKNRLKRGAVISKNYANCPECNAINLPTTKDMAYEVDERTGYWLTCWSCKKEFYT